MRARRLASIEAGAPWVAFAGRRAAVDVGSPPQPALQIADLKLEADTGGVGILVGGPGLNVARFADTDEAPRVACAGDIRLLSDPQEGGGTSRTLPISRP